MKPQNFPERLIWYAILGTYVFYLVGGLYIVGSILGWILFFYLCYQLWQQTENTPESEKIHIPWSIWVWIASMLVMELSLIIGHLDFNLGFAQLVKSSIGWAKGWALLAVYPLVGCLKIRPKLMYRAAAIICTISLFVSILLVLSFYLHLPQQLYVSPLQIVGGSGPEFFEVRLYEIDPGTGQPRWRLFAPWAPAAGLVANIYFFMILQEQNKKLRWLGMAGCICICTITASRLALLCLPVVWLLTHLLTRFNRPMLLMGMGIFSFTGSIFAAQLIEVISAFSNIFTAARKDSSRVRATLGRIALDRWEKEAPIWGHGSVEKGGHIVAYMPIGSHHSWFGLLYVKGIVGFIALALPMLCCFIDLLIASQNRQTAKVGLSLILVLFLYTFGENLEILVYLIWPGLIMIGIGCQEK